MRLKFIQFIKNDLPQILLLIQFYITLAKRKYYNYQSAYTIKKMANSSGWFFKSI